MHPCWQILEHALWGLSIGNTPRRVVKRLVLTGGCGDVFSKSSSAAFQQKCFFCADVTDQRMDAQVQAKDKSFVAMDHLGAVWIPKKELEAGDKRQHEMDQTSDRSPSDLVIKRYDRLTKRAKLGRLRAKVFGPKADADTLREWDKCAQAALDDIDQTTPARFAFILESCSVVGFVSEPLFEQLLGRVTSGADGLGVFNSQEIGMVVQSLGVLTRAQSKNVKEGHFLHTSCHEFVKSLVEHCRAKRALWRDEFDVGVLGRIMHGLGLLRQAGNWDSEDRLVKVLGEVVARAFLEKLERGVACTAADLSDFLHGCANYGYRNAQVLAPLREVAIGWLRVEGNTLSLATSDVVKLVWAFGQMGHWNTELMHLLAPLVENKVTEMSDALLTHTVDSLGAIQGCELNEGLVQKLTIEVCSAERLPRFKRQQLTKIVSGVGRLKLGCPEVLRTLGDEVLKLERMDRFALDELLGIFDGFARGGVTDLGLLGRLLEKCDKNVTNLSSAEFSNLVYNISLIKERLENEMKKAGNSLRKSHTKIDPGRKKIIKEQVKDQKDFVSAMVVLTGRLISMIPRGAIVFSATEVVILFKSLARIRNLNFDKMLELLKRYHSLVRLPRQEIANWADMGVVLESSVAINLLASIAWPNLDVQRFYQFSREWVLLNLDSGPTITSLTQVLWGLVRFSDRISMEYVDKVLARVSALLRENHYVSLPDWTRLANTYLCLRYLHGIDLGTSKSSPLFDLAKDRWRENLTARSELKSGISKYFALLGVKFDQNVLVVEDMVRLDMLVRVENGKDLAIICDEVSNFQENKIDSDDHLSRHGHRMLMGEPYFRNEVVEAVGYQVVLLPNYTSSKWKMAALTALFIQKGLLIEEFSESGQSFVRTPTGAPEFRI